jgi:large subunit ribosomal protein L17
MLSNMACSLIEHKRITTTVAKAKALRKFVEPLITKSKTDSTHSRRVVFSNLKSKDTVSELFREVAPKVAQREGGYTRIIKLGTRLGDSAEMCMIELVDFNEIMLADTKTKAKRSRRGGKKKSATPSAVVAAKETVQEKASEAGEGIAKAVEDVKEAAGEAVEEVKETVAEAAEKVEEKVDEVKDKVEGATDENPEASDADQKEDKDKKE